MLSDGKTVTIESTEVEELQEADSTYNFEVSDFHTYYVSDSKVLVHNDCKFYEATRTEDGVLKGKEITRKQALNRVRNGKDVIATSRSGAKSLAKAAFGNSKVYPEIHLNIENSMKHFHDYMHHVYRVFYS